MKENYTKLAVSFCGLTQTLPPHEVDLCLSKQRIFGNTKIQSLSGSDP